MGFGYLLIGYILAFVFSLSNVYFFTDIIGAVVMFVGLTKLAAHGNNFQRAMLADAVYLLICFVRAVLLLFRFMDMEGALATVFSILILLATLVLQFFIFAGIYYLALEVELEKESRRARQNLVMILIGCLLGVIAYLLAPSLGKTGNIIAFCVLLYRLIVMVMNVLLIHTCYCRICLKGQENGERTKSKYEWLNRMNEKMDTVMDGAFMRQKKTRKPKEEPSAAEPGYLRVKRKKNRRK